VADPDVHKQGGINGSVAMRRCRFSECQPQSEDAIIPEETIEGGK